MKPSKTPTSIDIGKLIESSEARQKYKQQVTENIQKSTSVNVQEIWDNIKASCLNAAKDILGETERTTKSQNDGIVRLSENQKKISDDINSTKDIEKKRELKPKRNRIMKEIHAKREDEEVKEILKLVDEVEGYNDNSRRMFQVVK